MEHNQKQKQNINLMSFINNTSFGIEIELCLSQKFIPKQIMPISYNEIAKKLCDKLNDHSNNASDNNKTRIKIKGYEQDKQNQHKTNIWKIENDDSVSCCEKYQSMELISPKMGVDKLDELKRILNILIENGSINNTTGLHIHISNTTVTTAEQFNKFLYLYLSFENIIFFMLDPSRNKNLVSSPLMKNKVVRYWYDNYKNNIKKNIYLR